MPFLFSPAQPSIDQCIPLLKPKLSEIIVHLTFIPPFASKENNIQHSIDRLSNRIVRARHSNASIEESISMSLKIVPRIRKLPPWKFINIELKFGGSENVPTVDETLRNILEEFARDLGSIGGCPVSIRTSPFIPDSTSRVSGLVDHDELLHYIPSTCTINLCLSRQLDNAEKSNSNAVSSRSTEAEIARLISIGLNLSGVKLREDLLQSLSPCEHPKLDSTSDDSSFLKCLPTHLRGGVRKQYRPCLRRIKKRNLHDHSHSDIDLGYGGSHFSAQPFPKYDPNVDLTYLFETDGIYRVGTYISPTVITKRREMLSKVSGLVSAKAIHNTRCYNSCAESNVELISEQLIHSSRSNNSIIEFNPRYHCDTVSQPYVSLGLGCSGLGTDSSYMRLRGGVGDTDGNSPDPINSTSAPSRRTRIRDQFRAMLNKNPLKFILGKFSCKKPTQTPQERGYIELEEVHSREELEEKFEREVREKGISHDSPSKQDDYQRAMNEYNLFLEQIIEIKTSLREIEELLPEDCDEVRKYRSIRKDAIALENFDKRMAQIDRQKDGPLDMKSRLKFINRACKEANVVKGIFHKRRDLARIAWRNLLYSDSDSTTPLLRGGAGPPKRFQRRYRMGIQEFAKFQSENEPIAGPAPTSSQIVGSETPTQTAEALEPTQTVESPTSTEIAEAPTPTQTVEGPIPTQTTETLTPTETVEPPTFTQAAEPLNHTQIVEPGTPMQAQESLASNQAVVSPNPTQTILMSNPTQAVESVTPGQKGVSQNPTQIVEPPPARPALQTHQQHDSIDSGVGGLKDTGSQQKDEATQDEAAKDEPAQDGNPVPAYESSESQNRYTVEVAEATESSDEDNVEQSNTLGNSNNIVKLNDSEELDSVEDSDDFEEPKSLEGPKSVNETGNAGSETGTLESSEPEELERFARQRLERAREQLERQTRLKDEIGDIAAEFFDLVNEIAFKRHAILDGDPLTKAGFESRIIDDDVAAITRYIKCKWEISRILDEETLYSYQVTRAENCVIGARCVKHIMDNWYAAVVERRENSTFEPATTGSLGILDNWEYVPALPETWSSPTLRRRSSVGVASASTPQSKAVEKKPGESSKSSARRPFRKSYPAVEERGESSKSNSPVDNSNITAQINELEAKNGIEVTSVSRRSSKDHSINERGAKITSLRENIEEEDYQPQIEEECIETLTVLGATRAEAINILIATEGDVQRAANIFYEEDPLVNDDAYDLLEDAEADINGLVASMGVSPRKAFIALLLSEDDVGKAVLHLSADFTYDADDEVTEAANDDKVVGSGGKKGKEV
ncbi:8db2a06d-5958-4bdc-835a-29eab9e00c8a [Sclerotinia trifoliorum]|uniref:8db2a06d-5958-4bdc-835a-29eab9e00c8a n=1 Tax=Sclerotinia trifoliorum TaxID=28548 RepID=A0A8H2VXT7_9HELO|nr:8db2a06d-5958-4bdc-835a-29eab9e00c8a [Sclerotinia trifoliorum]